MEFVNEKLNEFNRFLKNRKIAIVGLDADNVSLIDYMHFYGAEISVFDNRNIDEIEKNIMEKLTQCGIHFSFGKEAMNKLEDFEIIFRSPEYSPLITEIKKEEEKGCIVTTMIEMFMKICPAKIIGITGSYKTIAAELIYKILVNAEYKCYCNKNISENNLFYKLSEITENDIVVLNLSKNQLIEMDISPNIAVITEVIEKENEELKNAIKNIYRYQNEEDILIVNYENKDVKEIETLSKVIYYSIKTKLENGWILDDEIIKHCIDKLRKHIINVKDIEIDEINNFESILATLAVVNMFTDIKNAVNLIKDIKK